MGEIITITDAAKRLSVKSHVLRYWEEEIGLNIKRDKVGHRYYDERDIRMFEEIMRLKDRGFTLKDIKEAVEQQKKHELDSKRVSAETEAEVEELKLEKKSEVKQSSVTEPGEKIEQALDDKCRNEEKALEQSQGKEKDKEVTGSSRGVRVVDINQIKLQNMMNKVIANALKENRDIITSSIREEVTQDVMKQFDAVIREQEDRDIERFKKLDEHIRQLQQANLEAAATKSRLFFGRRRK